MDIWYEVEDALETASDEAERQVHAECRFEVWEWCANENFSEAGLLARFPNRRLADLFIKSLNDNLHSTGRGMLYPKDYRQTVLDRFYAADQSDSSVH
jgi:hypothetical protein